MQLGMRIRQTDEVDPHSVKKWILQQEMFLMLLAFSFPKDKVRKTKRRIHVESCGNSEDDEIPQRFL
ncbi:hypothetical protein [Virgibacillus sp. L01]|uniref:hypothetical protein n=1 Tax=Virgibacillus sp. L01 TaxID=3457429 RepID=UPI003FD09122